MVSQAAFEQYRNRQDSVRLSSPHTSGAQTRMPWSGCVEGESLHHLGVPFDRAEATTTFDDSVEQGCAPHAPPPRLHPCRPTQPGRRPDAARPPTTQPVPIPASPSPERPTATPQPRLPITAPVAHQLADLCRASADGAQTSTACFAESGSHGSSGAGCAGAWRPSLRLPAGPPAPPGRRLRPRDLRSQRPLRSPPQILAMQVPT